MCIFSPLCRIFFFLLNDLSFYRNFLFYRKIEILMHKTNFYLPTPPLLINTSFILLIILSDLFGIFCRNILQHIIEIKVSHFPNLCFLRVISLNLFQSDKFKSKNESKSYFDLHKMNFVRI